MQPLTALELLSPAKDLETGRIAIDYGADAVYIGGPSFGARQAAGNTIDDIAHLADYAHVYHAKVFMALNTLLTSREEVLSAQKLAFEAEKAGVDVLIIQDLGLLNVELPKSIELHASTQCDISTPQRAAFLEGLGFDQLVLARELSLDDIRAYRARLQRARIEFFIHGALCVSLSGRCYMSEAMLSRSANRGACAQLCRLPYNVYNQEGQCLKEMSHVLSLKDNNQTTSLDALIDAGVSSFKIEGRLKDANYVKNVTAHYRLALDEIISRRPELTRTSAGVSTFDFTPDPEKTFNRGFCEYFVHGQDFSKPYDLAQLDSPKNVGQSVARIKHLGTSSLILTLFPGVEISNGDGLTYLNEGEIFGLAVNRVVSLRPQEVEVFFRDPQLPSVLKVGMTLSRNRDQAFLRTLEKSLVVRRIPIHMTLLADRLKVSDGTHEATLDLPSLTEKAQNQEKNRQTLTRNLSKVGNTHYQLSSLTLSEDFDFFVPASLVNEWRRTVLEALDKVREAERARPKRRLVENRPPYPSDTIDYRLNVANPLAEALYRDAGAIHIEPAFELTHRLDADLMTTRHCVRRALNLCPKTMIYQPEALKALGPAAFRPEKLILENSARELFEAHFHCKAKPCFMTIVKKTD